MANSDSSEQSLSFLEHLEELRVRLIISVVALAIGTLLGYFLAPWAMDLLALPIVRAQEQTAQEIDQHTIDVEINEDGTLRIINLEQFKQQEHFPQHVALYEGEGEEPVKIWSSRRTSPIIYLRPMDPFIIQLKTALVLGIIFSLPVILYQIWAFVAPGLMPKERRLAIPLIFTGSILFPLGAAFAYYLLEFTLIFFSHFIMDFGMVQNDAREYLGFALTMMLSFGIVFEFPLGIVLATRTGLVTVEWLSTRRKYVFLFLLVLAAVVTPTGDPVTLMAMTLPLQILFELSLIASRVLDRMAGKEAEKQSDPSEDG